MPCCILLAIMCMYDLRHHIILIHQIDRGRVVSQLKKLIDSEGVAVSSHCFVDGMGYHIYDLSARRCNTYLGYTRKVTHQTGIFQITILVNLQGTVHQSVHKFNGYCGLVC
jgi:hypothetical protein